MTMDISETLAPASDQLDAIELVASPRTFTIEKVSAGSVEQPINVHLAEFPRVWRPSKGMRRVLAAGWGVDASKWTGHRVTLYFDPNVSFGKERTGGTRISHMTNLPDGKRLSIPMLISRGKSAIFTVEPLVEATPARTAPTNPNTDMLAEIGALADKLPGGRKMVATEWAESHDGQSLRDATDLGGLELLRDDLTATAKLMSERAAS